jgi:type VI secretion system protein ImpI
MMRLELKQIQGPVRETASERWFLERGRRTLGRSIDCDWQVADTARTVSKLHCTILRDRDGFLLRDESANGTRVDGVLVLEGETARLSNDTRLEFGGFIFSVAVSGERDRDIADPDAGLSLSDENLTISAILADISPGGQTGSGILGGRAPDDWLPPAAEPVATGAARRKDAAPSSRNVEIGWSGPPETSAMTPVLPNDWNATSDYGNHLEHASATYVSVPMVRNRKRAEDSEAETPVTKADARAELFAEPAREETTKDETTKDETTKDETTWTGAVAEVATPALLPRLEALLRQCEETSGESFAAFEIEAETLTETPNLFGASREEAIMLRLQALLVRQRVLNTALEGLIQDASHVMEPRIVEARVDGEFPRLLWRSNRNYWLAYRRHFVSEGRNLSIREFFRRAMLRALGKTEGDTASTTSKVVRTE